MRGGRAHFIYTQVVGLDKFCWMGIGQNFLYAFMRIGSLVRGLFGRGGENVQKSKMMCTEARDVVYKPVFWP